MIILQTLIFASQELSQTPSKPYAGRSFHEHKTPSKTIKVIVRGKNGRFRFEAGEPGKVSIKTLTRADLVPKLDEVKLTQTWQGNELRLTVQENLKTPGKPNPSYPGATDYSLPLVEATIYVPSRTELDLDGLNLDYTISGVAGPIVAKTSNGNIAFAPLLSQSSSVYATTYNGKITSDLSLSGSSDGSVYLSSYNGAIRIRSVAPALHLKGGVFFDGNGFRKQDWYVVDGFFTRQKPKATVSTIDLEKKFVSPPYADAHCHHIDGAYLAQKMNETYLKEGTLYVQSMGNHAGLRDEANKVVNLPTAIDVAYANAGFTSDFGHPAFLYESLANPTPANMTQEERGAAIRARKRVDLGNAYWFVESERDLNRVWPRFLATDPDLLKVFLVNSAERAENLNGLPGAIGLDPAVLPLIVRKAHQSGLRVFAHVDTAVDFEIGFRAGVDGMAHMPGYGMGQESPAKFEISPAIASLAKGRVIQPTISIASEYGLENLPAIRELQSKNVRVLRDAGARFVVGSDKFLSTQRAEVASWSECGFDTATIFRSLVETTPQSIFPLRRIGRIAEGFEASFVVLGANPLLNGAKMFEPVSVYKRGRQVYPFATK